MPREIRTELQTMLDSLHCGQCDAYDIVLTDATELHLSDVEVYVDRFGLTRHYSGKVVPRELVMSLDPEIDGTDFDVANVDMVAGQLLTGAERRLDGARCVVGTVFVSRDDPNPAAGQHVYDARVSGELVAGEVGERAVKFSFVSDVDAVVVAGRTVAEEFVWREPISVTPPGDPNDLRPIIEDPELVGRRGRYYGNNEGPLVETAGFL